MIERQTDRDRERQFVRPTERYTDRQTGRYRWKDRQTETDFDFWVYWSDDSLMPWPNLPTSLEKQTDRYTKTETERGWGRQRKREAETDRDTDRQAGRQTKTEINRQT